MKIIVTKNLYPKIGIVNGTIGYVQNNSIKKNGFIMMNWFTYEDFGRF